MSTAPVQYRANAVASALAFASDNTGNNTIVVVAQDNATSSGQTAMTIYDSNSNNYSTIVSTVNFKDTTHNATRVVVFAAAGIVPGPNTVTLGSNTTGSGLSIMEWLGPMVPSTNYQHPSKVTTGTSFSYTLTSSGAGLLLLAAGANAYVAGSGTWSANTGTTLLTSNTEAQATAYQNLITNPTVGGTLTLTYATNASNGITTGVVFLDPTLTFPSHITALPPVGAATGLRHYVRMLTVGQSVNSFTIASPFGSLYSATAHAFGSADTKNTTMGLSNIQNASGKVTLGPANSVTFNKPSSAQQDIAVLLQGV